MINYQDLSILSLLFTVIKQTNTKNKNKNRTSAMPRSSSQRHQRQRHDANNNGRRPRSKTFSGLPSDIQLLTDGVSVREITLKIV